MSHALAAEEIIILDDTTTDDEDDLQQQNEAGSSDGAHLSAEDRASKEKLFGDISTS